MNFNIFFQFSRLMTGVTSLVDGNIFQNLSELKGLNFLN